MDLKTIEGRLLPFWGVHVLHKVPEQGDDSSNLIIIVIMVIDRNDSKKWLSH